MLVELLSGYICDKRFVYQLIATLITLSAIRVLLFLRARKKRYQLFKYYGIPGPEPCLFDGHFYLYKDELAKYKLDIEFYKTYGKIYGIFIGDEPSLVIADLDKLKKVFFEEVDSFKERTPIFIETTLSDGILLARHHRWKVFRKVMSPFFSSYSMRVRGGASTQFIEDSVRLMIEYIEEKLNETRTSGKDIEIDIQDLMRATALHMISSMAIKLPGVQVKENEDNIRSLDLFLSQTDRGVIRIAIRFPLFNGLISFVARHFEQDQTLARIRRGLNSVIDNGLKRLSSQNGIDKNEQQSQLIDILIKLHHEGKITRNEVIGNAEAILFAGFDTTSTTLAYVFWVLAKHTDIQEKLRSELMAHGIESEYLEQVLNETMRLYPTVMIFTSRLATETITIDDLTIPQGTKVVFHSWLMHRNPEIWPEPEKFDPERFRKGTEIHPCAFAPFGLNQRKCLGYQLAMLEMKMIACDVLLRYRLELKSPKDLELIVYSVVLTKPKEKVIIRFEKL